MPYAAVERPSLALGLLSAQLRRHGITTHCEYANMSFASMIGVNPYKALESSYCGHMLGDWTFAAAARDDARGPSKRYVYQAAMAIAGRAGADPMTSLSLPKAVFSVEELTHAFIDDLATRLLARQPKVVGCSSVFEQHVASLALLRCIKQRAPHVVTMIGGPNCEGVLGRATLRHFPFIDIVVSGDADELIVDVAKHLLESGVDYQAQRLPFGCMSQKRKPIGDVPRAIVTDLDALPLPDFGDYFEQLRHSPLQPAVSPGLVIETSRGCWYGAKHHCTFCGQNGAALTFRSKQPARVVSEFAALAANYDICDFGVVDNIMDLAYFDAVLPALEASENDYRIFFELKSNLTREQMLKLHRAGIKSVLPGIETLDDALLNLMTKGNSALLNIQALKWGREIGMYLHWIMLMAVPGEDPDAYQRIYELIPLIHHLQPPNCLSPIEYHRFSPYAERPHEYGLSLRPFHGYAAIYPPEISGDHELAYYFVDAEATAVREMERPTLNALLEAWRSAFWERSAVLMMVDDPVDGCCTIVDSRQPGPVKRTRVDAVVKQLLLACDRSRPLPSALAAAKTSLGPQRGPELEAALERCRENGWVVERRERIVGLVLGQARMPKWDDYKAPNGILDQHISKRSTS